MGTSSPCAEHGVVQYWRVVWFALREVLMRNRAMFLLLVSSLAVASCGAGESGATTQPEVRTTTSTTTTTSLQTTTILQTTTMRTLITTTTVSSAPTPEAARPSLVVATEEGILLWREGSTEVLVDDVPTRVAFRLDDGTVVYQESRSRYHDEDQVPIMIRDQGAESRVLVGTDGVSPVLWGVGEVEGSPTVIYESWPVPCGRESDPECIGPLVALDLLDGSMRDLGPFSAPGCALGPSGMEGGIVLAYNSGAEIGEVGTFRLLDLEGNQIDNPVCLTAVDCTQPLRMIGAVSPGAERVAYVLDRMKESDELDYEIVDRRYGVVEFDTGNVLLTVELEAQGRLAWLDFSGDDGLVAVGREDGILTYLIGEDGGVEPAMVGGIATFAK